MYNQDNISDASTVIDNTPLELNVNIIDLSQNDDSTENDSQLALNVQTELNRSTRKRKQTEFLVPDVKIASKKKKSTTTAEPNDYGYPIEESDYIAIQRDGKWLGATVLEVNTVKQEMLIIYDPINGESSEWATEKMADLKFGHYSKQAPKNVLTFTHPDTGITYTIKAGTTAVVKSMPNQFPSYDLEKLDILSKLAAKLAKAYKLKP